MLQIDRIETDRFAIAEPQLCRIFLPVSTSTFSTTSAPFPAVRNESFVYKSLVMSANCTDFDSPEAQKRARDADRKGDFPNDEGRLLGNYAYVFVLDNMVF